MDTKRTGLMIALPSGKSLEEATLAVFKTAQVKVNRFNPRSCTADISGLPGITRAVFIKPSQIPKLVSCGHVPIGITGKDAVLEDGGFAKICAELSYSRTTSGNTRCVIFAREDDPIKSVQDLEDKPILSEYPKETAEFLKKNGVSASVHDCTGSAESLVAIGSYRYGVALTETGTSLRVNRLKEIATVFVSQTVLIVNRSIYKDDPSARKYVDFLGRLLNGVLNARGKVYLVMNAPVGRVSDICKLLPALRNPTVQPLNDPAFCSIATVVPAEMLNELKMKLGALGADGFVELDPASVM